VGTFEPSSFDPGKSGLLAKYRDPMIRFLMDRKFPWLKRISSAPPPGQPVGSRLSNTEPPRRKTTVEGGRLTADGAADVAQYEQHLSSLSATALKHLFDQEAATHIELMRNAAKIKKQLDENQRYARWRPADFEHWMRVALWNADEAVALSLGREPDARFGWGYVSQLLEISEFARAYERRRLLVYRAIQAGDLPNQMRPDQFMRWAAALKLEVPDALGPASTARQLPARAHPDVAETSSTSQSNATGDQLVRRKEFPKEYAGRIRKGEARLKEFFDGKTRKRGEVPEAAQFRAPKSGYYLRDDMIEYLRSCGDYSEIGW